MVDAKPVPKNFGLLVNTLYINVCLKATQNEQISSSVDANLGLWKFLSVSRYDYIMLPSSHLLTGHNSPSKFTAIVTIPYKDCFYDTLVYLFKPQVSGGPHNTAQFNITWVRPVKQLYKNPPLF